MENNQQQAWVQQLSRDLELLRSRIHTLQIHQGRLDREAERLRNEIQSARSAERLPLAR